MKKFLKKIIATNNSDLRVISAICSGSKVNQTKIKFLRENRVFLIPLIRIDKIGDKGLKELNSIVKFEFIYRSKSKNIDQRNKNNILELLAIDILKNKNNFEIIILFSNNSVIKLETEIIDVTLEDIIEKDA